MNYLLLKIASRCNINCDYCYWFRDESVYEKPKILSKETALQLFFRLEEHVLTHSLSKFTILLHGGEPLLYGKKMFIWLMDGFKSLEKKTGCEFELLMTTNGMLIDDSWAEIFYNYGVLITVSLDGPENINDAHRVKFNGEGTHKEVIRGIELLKKYQVCYSVLAVADVENSPKQVVDYFVEDLGIAKFDVLMPDNNHDDKPPSISKYYIELFDLWFSHYAEKGIDIRLPKAMLKGILGGHSNIESIGYGPIVFLTINTDGTMEPLDVLRIAGAGFNDTNLNVFSNKLQDILANKKWFDALNATLNLNEKCLSCEYMQACGGGYLPHRYSKENGFDNPSVYCNDLKGIFFHILSKVKSETTIEI